MDSLLRCRILSRTIDFLHCSMSRLECHFDYLFGLVDRIRSKCRWSDRTSTLNERKNERSLSDWTSRSESDGGEFGIVSCHSLVGLLLEHVGDSFPEQNWSVLGTFGEQTSSIDLSGLHRWEKPVLSHVFITFAGICRCRRRYRSIEDLHQREISQFGTAETQFSREEHLSTFHMFCRLVTRCFAFPFADVSFTSDSKNIRIVFESVKDTVLASNLYYWTPYWFPFSCVSMFEKKNKCQINDEEKKEAENTLEQDVQNSKTHEKENEALTHRWTIHDKKNKTNAINAHRQLHRPNSPDYAEHWDHLFHLVTSRCVVCLCPRKMRKTFTIDSLIKGNQPTFISISPRHFNSKVPNFSRIAVVLDETWIRNALPFDSIRDAVFTFRIEKQTNNQIVSSAQWALTVSPNKQNRGIFRPTTPVTHGPEWMPIRNNSCVSGRWRIRKLSTPLSSAKERRAISRAWRSPLRMGRPETTI